jgi:hypothetical protein
MSCSLVEESLPKDLSRQARNNCEVGLLFDLEDGGEIFLRYLG